MIRDRLRTVKCNSISGKLNGDQGCVETANVIASIEINDCFSNNPWKNCSRRNFKSAGVPRRSFLDTTDNWQSARAGRFQFAVGRSSRIHEQKINSRRRRQGEKNEEESGQTDGRTTTYVITFETNSPPLRENRSSPALAPAITHRFVAVTDVEPAQFDSCISLNSERLVNRKLKAGPERQRPFVPGGASKKKGRDKRVKSGRPLPGAVSVQIARRRNGRNGRRKRESRHDNAFGAPNTI